ncbi:MAG: DUF4255 domain-containing protein [Pseudomonadota bacterium]|nr:DUF4255 domain-containing protein [Pseudomonadota bacterium]
MADIGAIAAVSRTMRRLVTDRMATNGVTVTLAPPDVKVGNVNGPRINLYLYQVLEHVQLKNQGLPGEGNPGRYGHPPLSLNLRYLMTSYASSDDQPDSDLIAQGLLADAMLVLHDFGSRIDDLKLVTNRIGSIGDRLLDKDLRGEHERVKLMLHPAPVDEITKLWSAMPQANFRRSVAYEVTVVQIEGKIPKHQAPPVDTRRILATVSRPPQLKEAYLTPPPPPNDHLRVRRVAVGDEISIEHYSPNFKRLYVQLGKLDPIRVPLPAPGPIKVKVPDHQYPVDLDHSAPRAIPAAKRLQPGAMEVVLIGVVDAEGVAGGLGRGLPVAGEREVRSNGELLQLLPSVSGVNPTSGDDTIVLQVMGNRLWSEDLPSEVIVGDAVIPVRLPRPSDPWAAPAPTQVEIPTKSIAAALKPRTKPYAVAVQVNGARSRETTFSFRLKP